MRISRVAGVYPWQRIGIIRIKQSTQNHQEPLFLTITMGEDHKLYWALFNISVSFSASGSLRNGWRIHGPGLTDGVLPTGPPNQARSSQSCAFSVDVKSVVSRLTTGGCWHSWVWFFSIHNLCLRVASWNGCIVNIDDNGR